MAYASFSSAALDERYCETCECGQKINGLCIPCALRSNEEAPYRQIGGDCHPPRESSDFSYE